ncbi:MAG: NYN domain-containing protein [Bacillota bacterium]
MKDHLVVDGYNVIFNSPELKDLNDLEHARARLIDTLVNFAALAGQRVTVVFDAHSVPGGVARTERHGPVEVIYTSGGETADTVIERLVGRLSGWPAPVFVVTADYVEQRVVLGLGAYRVPPGEFWEKVRRLSRESFIHHRDKPADSYLENRLEERTRAALEAWRRKKPHG